MPHSPFIHLRVHTAYSLLEGAIQIKSLAGLCQKFDMPAVAMTDTGNMFGALEFSEVMWGEGIQPIIGTALSVSADIEVALGARRPDPDTLVLLAQSEAGYANLMKLSSKAFLDSEPGEIPQITMEDLRGRADGLICLTGGVSGPIGRALLDEQKEKAEKALNELKSMFSDRLYMEIQRHGTDQERMIEADLIDLAYAHSVPLVATNEPYFSDPEMHEAHDALICIADGTHVAEPDRRHVSQEHWFKGPDDMAALFQDLPEAIENTIGIARRIAFRTMQREPLLPTFPCEEGRSEEDELRAIAEKGLKVRIAAEVLPGEPDASLHGDLEKTYWERLEYELGVIIRMGYHGYFLIVADFIRWSRAHDVPVGPGRGSGAASLVAWALTITDVDPLKFTLPFERFLNPERVSMPDFDVDFCQEKRGDVIRYVRDKYGADRVAHIITFGTLQARAVLRDVGRVLEMPYGQVDRLCKMVPNNPTDPVTLEKAIADEPRLQEERDGDETVARLLDIGQKLEGLFRHASTHAAGVVISDRPLDELVPLYRDPRSDMPVTQFNMKWVEPAGLVKHDFLGLKTLTLIKRAESLIADRGIEVNVARIPLDDPAAFEIMSKAETVGIFQFESAGMQNILRQLRPKKFDLLIALNALFRPGPMDSIPDYIARMTGKQLPDYLHPSLEEILKETAGVMTYQEQVMQVAQQLSGYSLGDADLLRRAMAKKIPAEMAEQREKFLEGATERDVNPAQASYIFDLIAKFAGYGFPKSHAAAYALVAYQTAYLKGNYPLEFMAASMTLDLGNTDKLNIFRQEAVRMGVIVLPPDINRSEVEFSVEREGNWPDTDPERDKSLGAVRYALAAIKGVGRAAMDLIVAERRENGAFQDLFDFAQRIDQQSVNKRQLENLVKSGALDCLNPNRAQSLAALDTLLAHTHAAAHDRASSQESLFGEDMMEAEAPRLDDVEELAPLEKLLCEFEALGFYLTGHPIEAFGDAPARLGASTFAAMTEKADLAVDRYKVACIVLTKRERRSQRGTRFADVTLSDPTGVQEVRVFSDLLTMKRELLESGEPVLATLEVERRDEDLEVRARDFEPLDAKAASAVSGLCVFLSDTEHLVELRNVLGREAGGNGRVHLILATQANVQEAEIALPEAYKISPAMRAAIKGLPGVLEVRDV